MKKRIAEIAILLLTAVTAYDILESIKDKLIRRKW